MSNRRFESNAKMASFYFRELLDDGLEHSSKEIVDYVFEKAGGLGVDGERLTETMVKSGIWYNIRRGDALYCQSRRGHYRKSLPESLAGYGSGSIRGQLLRIVKDAHRDAARYFHVDISAVTLTEDELLELQQLQKDVLERLTELIDILQGQMPPVRDAAAVRQGKEAKGSNNG
jgi:hypothetical protein